MNPIHERLRQLLCELGTAIRDGILEQRNNGGGADFANVAGAGGGDTIYQVDRVGEAAILVWFSTHWPADLPVEIVMEGLTEPVAFPAGTSLGATDWKLLIDPVDGTRGLMVDKRGAWALAGVAPQRGSETRLSEIVASAMTEIPVTKVWRADQFSVARDGEVVGTATDVRARRPPEPLFTSPSQARTFEHGFASMVKFFPEGRTLTAQIEEQLWDELIGLGKHDSPVVFDDQYLSTGGQFHELLVGRDRMVGDLRPLVMRLLDMETQLVCHPYDACAWPVLERAGVVFEHPMGGFPDAPMDTSSGIAWVAYANPHLAGLARPVLQKILHRLLP